MKPVAPALALIGIYPEISAGPEVYIGAKRIFLFTDDIAARVIIPDEGLARSMVVLSPEAVQSVVAVLCKKILTAAYRFGISGFVIGIAHGNRIGIDSENMAGNLCNHLCRDRLSGIGR